MTRITTPTTTDRTARRRLLPIVMLAAVLLAACGRPAQPGDPPPDGAGPPDGLVGAWELVEGAGPDGEVPLVDDHPITLEATGEDDVLGGRAACNSYSGRYQIDGDRLTMHELLWTEMACPGEGVMESEAAYLAALQHVERVVRDGDRLVLSGPDTELVFAALPEEIDQPLTGTTWELDTLLDGEVAMSTVGEVATLVLREDGSFEATTGCRGATGTFVERSGVLDTDELAVQDLACPPEVADQDEHVLAVLDAGFRFEVDGARLTITADDGRGLGYRAG